MARSTAPWAAAPAVLLMALMLGPATHAQTSSSSNSSSGTNSSSSAMSLAAAAANEPAGCQAALAAQTLLLNTFAAMRNLTPPFTQVPSLVPSKELITAAGNATKEVGVMAQPMDNLATVFRMTPYDYWGNALFQIAISQAVHVPSAVLGEMMYVSNMIIRDWSTAFQVAIAANATVPASETLGFWTDRWMEMSDQLLEDSKDIDDIISKRAMVLRSMNYAYVGWYAQPSSDGYTPAYQNATQTFREAMDLFDSYQTNFFKAPYSNGTAEGELDAFLVTPSPNQQSPLLVFVSSGYNWKEVQFMRYGLAALRRGYAVLHFDMPGQGFALRNPPHFTTSKDGAGAVSAVLKAVNSTKELSEVVNMDEVAVVGISLGSYAALDACTALMPSTIKGCVLNPPILDLAEMSVEVLSDRVYKPLQQVAETQPELFDDEVLAQAFADPTKAVLLSLMEECSPTSGSVQLLGALFRQSTDPELLYPAVMNLGKLNVTFDDLASSYYWTIKYGLENLGKIDVSGMSGSVLLLGGTQDHDTGSQFDDVQEALKETDAEVKAVQFGPETGAALNTQVGAVTYWELETFPWLAQVFGSSGDGSEGEDDATEEATAQSKQP